MKPSALRVEVSKDVGDVSALLLRPDAARCLLVLAHGAGAGMRHTFMESIAERLARRGVATLRYQFPYLEAGRRAPNPPALLTATVRAAVDVAADVAGDLPLLAGGKSMGGRMTSLAAAAASLPGVRGIVFFGFPLHAAGRPATERGDHLRGVSVPMLFVQGTRDRLADLALMRPLCDDLGAHAELHVVEGGDHSFHVPKRAGRSDAEVLDELAAAVEAWATKLV
jgi:hypothetical protein